LKVTYTDEAVADIVEAITYLNERNPTAAANLDDDIAECIERLADREFDGPVSRLRSGAVVRSWSVPGVRCAPSDTSLATRGRSERCRRSTPWQSG
jgi:plasmid stabilization system protein ParE